MMPKRRIVVSMDEQQMSIMEDGRCLRRYAVSTATRGMGCTPDSLRTPTGTFRICEKVGADQPCGTIFKARVPVGQWRQGEAPDEDLVLTRILRLDGIEPANTNTLQRFIYIHGTNREDLLGRPASHGCVRLANRDMIELFELAQVDDPVEILPLTRRRGGILFLEFDGVVSACHGLMELALLCGNVFPDDPTARIALSAGGLVPDEAIRRAIETIRPDRTMCNEAARRCAASLHGGTGDVIAAAQASGWLVVLLTRGPLPLLQRAAEILGIRHFEGLPLSFTADGSYAACGTGFTTTGGLDIAELIEDWDRALLPQRTCLIGNPPARRVARAGFWNSIPDRSAFERALAGGFHHPGMA